MRQIPIEMVKAGVDQSRAKQNALNGKLKDMQHITASIAGNPVLCIETRDFLGLLTGGGKKQL